MGLPEQPVLHVVVVVEAVRADLVAVTIVLSNGGEYGLAQQAVGVCRHVAGEELALVEDGYVAKQLAVGLQQSEAVARRDVVAYVGVALGERYSHAVCAALIVVVGEVYLRRVEVAVALRV